ncbi:MAG: hypothetical protein IIU24_07545 [Selenomonas sp.]|uniref:hypothetical protein n=1 Tax=Selenomonas sp. AE3005 TaxID=1485543 RepID=UPI0004845651|nr:hypothetical protein [Selenomonas sp. AE3005]MBQ5419946.1 hypothetical protein [Selenomonas sp.]
MSLKKVFPLLFLLTLMLSSSAFAEKATVVYYNAVNKSVVVSSFHGYSCGWVRKYYAKPHRLHPGDVLEGSFVLGSHRCSDESNERDVEIYFDEWWVKKDVAHKWVETQEDKDCFW